MDRAIPYVLVGLLALALVVVLGFVAVRGIGELDGGGGGYEAWDEGQDQWAGEGADPAFAYVEPARFVTSAPARAWIGLPRTTAELRMLDAQRLPVARVRGYLAVGNDIMRVSLVDAMRAAQADGAPEDMLAAAFDAMIAGHPTRAHCAWLRERVGTADVPRLAAFWVALAACDDRESAALFLRGGARAPEEAMAQERGALSLRGAGARVPEEAMAVFMERHAWLAEEPRRALEDRVEDPFVDLSVLAASGWDEEQAGRALVRCATADPDVARHGEWRSAECLHALYEESPALAVQAARAVQRREPELAYLSELATVLEGNRAAEQVVLQLVDRQLVQPGDLTPGASPEGIAPRDLLVHYGRAMCFETQPGTFPVGHDGLLVRLAWLARPHLDHVVFDETPPYAGDYAYRVHAYADDTEHTVEARNFGGRYDTYAALGLLNVLLRDRYAETRLALLDTPSAEIACVVAGPEQALLAAEQEGSITLADVASW